MSESTEKLLTHTCKETKTDTVVQRAIIGSILAASEGFRAEAREKRKDR